MNPTPENPLASGAVPASASIEAVIDHTLRLITRVPVPEGLEDRVHAAILRSPARHKVLAWPVSAERSAFWAGSGWVRAAAAAAIVFVVAGGGWGVYRRAQHPVSKVLVMPGPQPTAREGFSSAGAMRTPQTVKGPVVVEPTKPVKKHARKKAPGHRASPTHAPVSPSAKAAAPIQPGSAMPIAAPVAAVGK